MQPTTKIVYALVNKPSNGTWRQLALVQMGDGAGNRVTTVDTITGH